jgi:bacillithiol biosynthesis deacetylase BshB1
LKLDILAFAAHPDDTELSCSGTIASHIAEGKKVGVVDFTRGELGTRGTPETRDQEAKEASEILGLSVRENLGFADGFFQNDQAHQLKVIEVIRRYQPEIVLANAITDRHIDHGRAAQLAHDACFLAGLAKIITFDVHGNPQAAWRPKAVYHYIQDRYIQPAIVVDITNFWEIKVQAIRAFKTQFFDPNSAEPMTPISTPEFLDFLEGRAREMGRMIGVKYGEGFTKVTTPGVRSLFDLV